MIEYTTEIRELDMLNISQEDKMEIAQKYVENKKNIKHLKKVARLMMISGTAIVVIGTLVCVALVGPVALACLGLEIMPLIFADIAHTHAKGEIKYILNGKITLKEFKKLQKDKEFQDLVKTYDEWQKADEKMSQAIKNLLIDNKTKQVDRFSYQDNQKSSVLSDTTIKNIKTEIEKNNNSNKDKGMEM